MYITNSVKKCIILSVFCGVYILLHVHESVNLYVVLGILNITEGVSQSKGDQIASVSFPSLVFTSEQVKSEDKLSVAVQVYEMSTLFPLPNDEIQHGPETVVGTPVMSMIVAQNGRKLEFNPPVELTLAIMEEVYLYICVCCCVIRSNIIFYSIIHMHTSL